MNTEQQDIVDTVANVFRAVAADDLAAFKALVRDDFFIHENGQRFDGQGIFDLIVNAQRAGAVFEWEVTEPTTQVQGDLATIAYTNQGGVTRDGERTAVTWLETAVLTRTKASQQWQVAYMTSMRTAAPPAP
jgi:ketosteroid isomerase-like protein